MKLNRLTPAQQIDIWQPRWKDRTVLIAKHKVGTHNEIKFSKAPSLPDTYYLSGKDIQSCPIDTNGKLDCYAVPINKLEILERV